MTLANGRQSDSTNQRDKDVLLSTLVGQEHLLYGIKSTDSSNLACASELRYLLSNTTFMCIKFEDFVYLQRKGSEVRCS